MNSEQHIDQVIINISDAKPNKANLQCAPGREFEAGSCISLMVLEEMSQAYNKIASREEDKIRRSKNLSIINPQKYKLYLVHEIDQRLGEKRSEERRVGKECS